MALVLKPSTFRVHEDNHWDYEELRAWCRINRVSFNALLNSFIPALNYAVKNCIVTDEETGQKFIRADFGDVKLRNNSNAGQRYA